MRVCSSSQVHLRQFVIFLGAAGDTEHGRLLRRTPAERGCDPTSDMDLTLSEACALLQRYSFL